MLPAYVYIYVNNCIVYGDIDHVNLTDTCEITVFATNIDAIGLHQQ